MMKTIKWTADTDPEEVCREAAKVLGEDGLVCLPCNGRYRIVADLTSPKAVLRLVQSKGRVRKAPALVFVDSEASLSKVASSVDPLSLRLAGELWPQPLTIRVEPSGELPGKVRKQFGGSKSKLGVRIPADRLTRDVVARLGRPLLVSSANRERKSGESSSAQVRKTFSATVDLFVDRGDLDPGPRSTVIDVKGGELVVERVGAISEEELVKLVAG